jgi:hypothetical protein
MVTNRHLGIESQHQLHLKHGKQRRTVHWTERRPNRKVSPVVHPPVWLTIPAVPKT